MHQASNSTFPWGTVSALPALAMVICLFLLVNWWVSADYTSVFLFNPSDSNILNFLNIPIALGWCAINLACAGGLITGIVISFLCHDANDEDLSVVATIQGISGLGTLICLAAFKHMMYSSSTGGAFIIGGILALAVFLALFSGSESSSSSSSNGWNDEDNPFGGAGSFTNRDESEMRWMRNSSNPSTRKDYFDTFNKSGRTRNK